MWGGLIGFLFTLLLSFLILGPVNLWEGLIGFLLFTFIIFILPLALCGAFIGFLVSLTEGKFVWRSAIIGGVIGLFFSFIIQIYWFKFGWIIQPISRLNTLITGCKDWCIYMFVVYPIIFISLFSLIGALIGLIIWRLRK